MNQTTLTGHNDGFAEMEAFTIAKLKKVKDRVRYILECYPSARGDDRVLQYRYIQLFVPEVSLTFRQFKFLRMMPSPESITRARRLIQEKGEFPPTERTERKRRRREEIIRDSIHEV